METLSRIAALMGAVAQKSEQRHYKPLVDGAIPSRPTISPQLISL